MRSVDQTTNEELAGLEGVFSDIDDTLSTQGKLTAEAFSALWRLKEAGLRVLIITGRPAGWCDHIARFWPVDAVVGENGGFYFYHDGRRLRQRFLYDESTREEFRRRLEAVRDRILAEVPGCALASDQPYRVCDVAIDYCEDVPPLPPPEVMRIQRLFEAAGARAKISSVHVNGWYGDFDKVGTAVLAARELWDVVLERGDRRYAFCGDSPNDEPMFAYLPVSFGMANVTRFLHLMTHPPAYITSRPCGAGFCEVAERILRARTAGG